MLEEIGMFDFRAFETSGLFHDIWNFANLSRLDFGEETGGVGFGGEASGD